MKEKMTVSVCIPTYNQADYVEMAIRSAYDQTLKPIEIIVSDDASTDHTSEVLEKLSQEIETLKIIRQPKNLGIAKNTDACLRQAKGEFITRLDSDDFLNKHYEEKICELLNKYEKAGYGHAAVQEIDENNNHTRLRTLARKEVYQSANEALKAAKNGYRVAANIVTFRKSALEKVNYITGRPNYTEDYHLSADLAANGFGNVYLPEVLSNYRIWTDSGKIRMRRKLMEITGLTEIFDNVLNPAYIKRGWSLTPLNQKRTMLACAQSDCLSWDIYNSEEKEILHKKLLGLSSRWPAKMVSKLYKSGNGEVVNMFWKIKYHAAKTAKSIIYPTK